MSEIISSSVNLISSGYACIHAKSVVTAAAELNSCDSSGRNAVRCSTADCCNNSTSSDAPNGYDVSGVTIVHLLSFVGHLNYSHV